MSVELVFLLEEPSAEALLRGLMPRLLPNLRVHYLSFQGKTDLENNIPRKLLVYRAPATRILILRDQDSGNCQEIKSRIQGLCGQSGRNDVTVRIACRELESWYLGDLAAVERAFPNNRVSQFQQKAKYRSPDQLNNAAAELSRIVPEYQKISGSRAIAPHLSLEHNRSKSFQVFLRAVRSLGRGD